MRRKPRWAVLGIVMGLVIAAAIWYFRSAPPTKLELESASNVAWGLQIKVKDLKREGEKVTMTYVFEWVEEPTIRFGRRFGTIDIHFFDSDGLSIPDGQDDMYIVSEECRRSARTTSCTNDNSTGR
jgi:hypothetical protein